MRLLFAIALGVLALLLVAWLLLVRPAWAGAGRCTTAAGLVPLLSAGVLAGPDPVSEVCATIRAARAHQAHARQLSALQQQLERHVAERRRQYLEAGYSREWMDALMADADRRVEDGRRAVRDAEAAYTRLAQDLSRQVPEPWPACETPQ